MRTSLPAPRRRSKRSMRRSIPCCRICRREALSRAEQYARPHRDESFCWDEPYTLPENFFLAWQARSGQPLSRTGYPLSCGRLVLGSACRRGECAAWQARVQPRQRDEQRHAGLSCSRQREASARCAKTDSSSCATRRALPPAAGGPTKISASPAAERWARASTKTHSSFETPCGSYAPFQNHALSASRHRRQPLRRQHGARAL